MRACESNSDSETENSTNLKSEIMIDNASWSGFMVHSVVHYSDFMLCCLPIYV